MAETVLHPRPSFYTFLQADNPKGGDALTYYDYQRALRAKKVEILQQKRSTSYEPGYMKPWMSNSNSSRRVFQLKSRFPATLSPPTMDIQTDSKIPPLEPANETISKSCSSESSSSLDSTSSLDGPELNVNKFSLSGLPSGHPTDSHLAGASAANMTESSPTHVQTERLPRLSSKPRLIKSASAQDSSTRSPVPTPNLPKRPRTVAISDLRDSQTQTTQTQHGAQSNHEIKAAENAELCKSFQWSTTTQRSYDEMKWPDKPPIIRAYFPSTTMEQFPDPISQKLTYRRYNSAPAGWQTFGTEWDYAQTRQCDTYIRGPQAIAYCDCSKKIQQIPGYSGAVPRLNAYEESGSTNSPATPVRTLQPRRTKISRKANIPGYAGHVHWMKLSPAHNNMPVPEPTSMARTHRALPLEDEASPFRRDGVMSKMITTVSPYNPFNNIQY